MNLNHLLLLLFLGELEMVDDLTLHILKFLLEILMHEFYVKKLWFVLGDGLFFPNFVKLVVNIRFRKPIDKIYFFSWFDKD